MDFKAKPKDKGASEECLDLHSLKMLTIYDMNSGSLDGRKKKASIHNHFLMIPQNLRYKTTHIYDLRVSEGWDSGHSLAGSSGQGLISCNRGVHWAGVPSETLLSRLFFQTGVLAGSFQFLWL